MLGAATECFAEHGYPATTMTMIAERSGVAVQTLYSSFRNKRTILAESIGVAIAGDDEPVPVNDRPWMQPVWRATTGPATVRAYASAVRMIQQRTAALFRVLDIAAASEPDLAELWRVSREQRRLGAGGVVRAAAERSPLRPGMTIERAIDIVWTLNGHDVYFSLVEGCQWPLDDYEEWLGDTWASLLFGRELLGAADARPTRQDGTATRRV